MTMIGSYIYGPERRDTAASHKTATAGSSPHFPGEDAIAGNESGGRTIRKNMPISASLLVAQEIISSDATDGETSRIQMENSMHEEALRNNPFHDVILPPGSVGLFQEHLPNIDLAGNMLGVTLPEGTQRIDVKDVASRITQDADGTIHAPEGWEVRLIAPPARSLTVTIEGRTVTAERLDVKLKPVAIAELPEEEFQNALDALEHMLKGKYMQAEYLIEPDLSYLASHPSMKTYATVVVGGKTVATIDNQGAMTTSNAIHARLQQHIPNDVNGTNGPDLARARAEKIAQILGGKIIKAPTAITQAQFNAAPIDQEKLRPQFDASAMERDPLYAQIAQLKAQREAFLTQQAA